MNDFTSVSLRRAHLQVPDSAPVYHVDFNHVAQQQVDDYGVSDSLVNRHPMRTLPDAVIRVCVNHDVTVAHGALLKAYPYYAVMLAAVHDQAMTQRAQVLVDAVLAMRSYSDQQAQLDAYSLADVVAALAAQDVGAAAVAMRRVQLANGRQDKLAVWLERGRYGSRKGAIDA